MFRYPLLKEEIRAFITCAADENELAENLALLIYRGDVFEQGGYFLVQNDFSLIERRKKGNANATILMETARKISHILYQFPFVRGIGISGSLSKNFADEDSDIDFFIITAPNRLWVARTLMHLLKKLSFIRGKQHWFCMNYYISTEAMVIQEKNIFTATEVVTLIPVCGEDCFKQFFIANKWANTFYPNISLSEKDAILAEKGNRFKHLMESLLSNNAGNFLDNYWMKLTSKRWLKKERRHRINSKGEPMGLKTSKHFARPAPELFQKKILDQYAQKIKDIAIRHNKSEPVLP